MRNPPPQATAPATAASGAGLRVRDIGEFGLIARLQRRIEGRRGGGRSDALLLGIGDDAAVWRPTAGARQVITTDALVEDVHFRRSTTSWRDLGWKALAVNVSDVAAMGATPRYALVTLELPSETGIDDIEEVYDGMLDLATEFGVEIVGGDVVSSAVLSLNVTVIGEAAGELLRRDAGRAGDLLAVTGTLGGSMGGLRVLEAEGNRGGAVEALLEAHRRPRPRVREAAALVAAGVRCAMDLSDGLLGDAAHICERSGVGAVIAVQSVPVHPALAAAFGGEALGLAIGGGEDYELLCAASSEALARAETALAAIGTPLTVVGRLVDPPRAGSPVRLVGANGREVSPGGASWDHFRG